MKKLIALMIAALLALSAAAFAEIYRSDDITFEYDENAFEISLDDRTDDETNVVLHGKNEAWGNTFISFYLKDLDDGEKFPTMEEMSQIPDTTVTQGDWNGYKNVFMYTLEYDDVQPIENSATYPQCAGATATSATISATCRAYAFSSSGFEAKPRGISL